MNADSEVPDKRILAAALRELLNEPEPLFGAVMKEWQESWRERLGAIAGEAEDDRAVHTLIRMRLEHIEGVLRHCAVSAFKDLVINVCNESNATFFWKLDLHASELHPTGVSLDVTLRDVLDDDGLSAVLDLESYIAISFDGGPWEGIGTTTIYRNLSTVRVKGEEPQPGALNELDSLERQFDAPPAEGEPQNHQSFVDGTDDIYYAKAHYPTVAFGLFDYAAESIATTEGRVGPNNDRIFAGEPNETTDVRELEPNSLRLFAEVQSDLEELERLLQHSSTREEELRRAELWTRYLAAEVVKNSFGNTGSHGEVEIRQRLSRPDSSQAHLEVGKISWHISYLMSEAGALGKFSTKPFRVGLTFVGNRDGTAFIKHMQESASLSAAEPRQVQRQLALPAVTQAILNSLTAILRASMVSMPSINLSMHERRTAPDSPLLTLNEDYWPIDDIPF